MKRPLRLFFALLRNELRLYQIRLGLAIAAIFAITLLAAFRFALPKDPALSAVTLFVPMVQLLANLELVLVAIAWESEAFAYRYYLASGMGLELLFWSKTAAAFATGIPLWLVIVLT
ncbi:MAG: hypothetical protein NZL89_05510, partial [Leptospiraceae bacterium]|nr:hypothetical protein [Leptospiraceae bacterium]